MHPAVCDNKNGPKIWGGLCPLFEGGELVLHLAQCGLYQGPPPIKCLLDPSSHLATIDNRHGPEIPRRLCPPFGEEGWVPIEHKIPWDEAYLNTKWHHDASSRLDTVEIC